MKQSVIVLVAALAWQAFALPHGAVEKNGRSMATKPIIEEAGEGYRRRSMATKPIIEEAGEGYKRSMATKPIIEEAGEGYKEKRSPEGHVHVGMSDYW